MNTFWPSTLKSFVDEQVRQVSYDTSSGYLRELICEDKDRLHLRSLLVAGCSCLLCAGCRR